MLPNNRLQQAALRAAAEPERRTDWTAMKALGANTQSVPPPAAVRCHGSFELVLAHAQPEDNDDELARRSSLGLPTVTRLL